MIRKITSFFIVVTAFIACATNPVTGRKQFRLVSEQELQAMATQEYQQFLSTNRTVSPSADRDAEMVRRVGQRIATAVTNYYKQQGLGDVLDGYQWEYNLVNNKEANAWCMPGGKIVVYSGILPLTASDDELAVVIGHEIAHAVLKHGNERLSQQLLAQYGGAALSTLLSQKPAETQQLFNLAFGAGSTLGTLAFSRKQETESDEAGLYYMAYAKYDPNAAITFWEKMQQQGGAEPPEILSTHPSDQDRIAAIKTFLPKAIEYYNKE
jgi:predicted Zn-dependent protease